MNHLFVHQKELQCNSKCPMLNALFIIIMTIIYLTDNYSYVFSSVCLLAIIYCIVAIYSN